jgi:hypothetical protein
VSHPNDDPILQTRLDVAEMKGMLSQVISTHTAQIESQASRLNVHEARLNEKKATLARHDERIKGLEEDNSARWGRVTGLLALLVSAAAVVLTLVTRMT